jgi:adenylate kinase
MLGAPGSGKGTIGADICKHYNLTHLATGDIFREEIKNQTELGKEAEKYISQGKLVPDEITIKLVEKQLNELDGAVLDGFPRTLEQASALDTYLNAKGKSITAVIDLNVPDEDLVVRTSCRVMCSNKTCRAPYNTKFMPPKVEGKCDLCGGELVQRKDDNEETLKARLSEYHHNTEPLVNYYKGLNKLYTVNGVKPLDELMSDLNAIIG